MDYPAEARNVLSVGQPSGTLANIGALPVDTVTKNSDGVVTVVSQAIEKDFASLVDLENARIVLEAEGYNVKASVAPIYWIGTKKIDGPNGIYTEVISLKKV